MEQISITTDRVFECDRSKINVCNMSPPATTFMNLPQEILNLIYHHTFSDAQLTIEQEKHRPVNAPVTHIYRNSSFRPELLRVCRQIYSEAFPILAGKTSLLLLPGIQNPNQAVQKIPSIWLSRFRTILNNTRIRSRITHVLRQEYLDPTPFTHLQTYRLAHLIYPDWQDSCHKTTDIDLFVQKHLDSEFFFQAGTLKLFTRTRTYNLTVTIWLLRAFVEDSVGWELEFSLDTWTVTRKHKAKFRRHKDVLTSLWDDPKCRDYRHYDVEYLGVGR